MSKISEKLITDEIKEKERLFKALANRRRLAILRLLKNEKQMAVSDIADTMDLSIQATSKHLSVLKSVGLVDFEQQSLLFLYKIGTPSGTAKAVLSLI